MAKYINRGRQKEWDTERKRQRDKYKRQIEGSTEEIGNVDKFIYCNFVLGNDFPQQERELVFLMFFNS